MQQKIFHCKIPYKKPYTTNVEAVLKMPEKEKFKNILRVFKPFMKGKNGVNELKILLRDNNLVIKFIPIFSAYSQKRWQKLSGYDYFSGVHLSQKNAPNGQVSPAFTEKTLTQLLKIGNLKKSSLMPFVLNDEFYSTIKTASKKVIGRSYLYDQSNNSFILRDLLVCTVMNKTYLLYSDTTCYENYPGMSVSLNLLVNGFTKGIKPLYRYDTNGHLPKALCDQYNIPYRINERADAILDNEFYHTYASPKGTESIKVNMNEHMHKASYCGDILNACVYYLRHALLLRGEVNTSHMNPYNTHMYESLYPHEKVRDIAMTKDAFSLNGFIPFERITQFTNQEFHIDHNEKSDEFNQTIDQCRSNLYQNNFQHINSYLQQENLPIVSVFRPNDGHANIEETGFEIKK